MSALDFELFSGNALETAAVLALLGLDFELLIARVAVLLVCFCVELGFNLPTVVFGLALPAVLAFRRFGTAEVLDAWLAVFLLEMEDLTDLGVEAILTAPSIVPDKRIASSR